MKAVAVIEPGKVEVVEVKKPEIKEFECLVKVKTCGFCNSTDTKTIDNLIGGGNIPFPIILGHEQAGEVIECGNKVKNIKVGDRYINPYYSPEPPYSRYWGGMVEYAIVQDFVVMDEIGIDKSEYKARSATIIPKGISFEDAAMVLTLREIYSGLINFGIKKGMDVLIFGDGPVGAGLSKFCGMMGADKIYCAGHRKNRLEHIEKIVAPTATFDSSSIALEEVLGDNMVDLVIDAVGSVDIIKKSAKFVKPGGKIGVYGVVKEKYSELNLTELKNNTMIHMLNYPHGSERVHDEICQMILDGRINPSDFYSHVIDIKDVKKAIDMTINREAFKVILSM